MSEFSGQVTFIPGTGMVGYIYAIISIVHVQLEKIFFMPGPKFWGKIVKKVHFFRKNTTKSGEDFFLQKFCTTFSSVFSQKKKKNGKLLLIHKFSFFLPSGRSCG